METLTRAFLPRIPQFSIPFLNQFFGTQSCWTRSFCTSRSITIETHSTFMFPLVLPLCGNIKVSSTHQPDERPFLFHPPPFSDPRRDSSTTDLASGACSRTAAACNFNGRRRCSRFLMAPSSSSSPISGGETGDDTGEELGKYGEEAERALGMDENIPGGSCEFLHRVSSRAYDMRRNLLQTIDSCSYEVLQQNPWREDSKPVFVLTQQNNQLFTMKTRQSCSEVERELGLLFTRREKLDKQDNSKTKHPGTEINMLVEDIREGVLVFEDESEASRYCELLEGGGHKCEGIAELEVSSVFDICQKMRALAVLFRRGRTPPLPESLEQNLRARKRSLEDQD